MRALTRRRRADLAHVSAVSAHCRVLRCSAAPLLHPPTAALSTRRTRSHSPAATRAAAAAAAAARHAVQAVLTRRPNRASWSTWKVVQVFRT
jgi:hypothetical protein